MKKTLFAGLTVLEPGEGLSTDDGAFTDRDRLIIDRLLRIGAKTHRHNGLDGITNPAVAPGAAIIASAGAIPSDTAISLGYTLEDADGGETMLSPVTVVSTGPPTAEPHAAPSAAFVSSAGTLPVNSYFYVTTFTDGEGGETPAGPAAGAERLPGFASGSILLSNLTFGMAEVGAVGWRLYRAIGGGSYGLVATGGAGNDSYLDDGSGSADCDTTPPAGEQNTTKGVSTLVVTLPSAIAGAASINLYGTVTADFGGGSLLESYPAASAGATVSFSTLEFALVAPPDTNLSIGGAHLIDPDTELLDWHWKRPVGGSAGLGSGVEGDVRLSVGDGTLWAVLGASAVTAQDWTNIASGVTEGGGGTPLTVEADPNAVSNVNRLRVEASGVVEAELEEPEPGEALLRLTVPPVAGPPGADGKDGADGSDGAPGAPGASGAPGKDGKDGASGAPGPAGASGAPGPAGKDGASGAPGAPGKDGASGAPGAPGASGAPGAPGASGAPGKDGASGATGPAGASASITVRASGVSVKSAGVIDFGSGASVLESPTGTAVVTIVQSGGAAGPAGASGAPGAPGASGRWSGVMYNFDASGGISDPGAGKMKFVTTTVPVAEVLKELTVLDSLKRAAKPANFTKIPWAEQEGTWSATEGWRPPGFTAGKPAGTKAGFYYNTEQFNGDIAVGMTKNSGTIAAERQFELWLGMQNTAKPNGYQLNAYGVAANKVKFKLIRWEEEVGTTLFEEEHAYADGDSFFIARVGNKICAYWQSGEATPTLLAEVTDTKFMEGFVGFGGNGSNPIFTNLRVGSPILEVVNGLVFNDIDAEGNNVGALLGEFDNSTTLTNRGFLYVRKVKDPATLRVYKIIANNNDKGTWVLVTPELVSSTGTFNGGDLVSIEFARTGDASPSGQASPSWKNPVFPSGALPSGTIGDVRLVEQTGKLYGVLGNFASAADMWTELASGGAWTASAASGKPGPGIIVPTRKLTIVGSGGLVPRLDPAGAAPDEAKFNLYAPQMGEQATVVLRCFCILRSAAAAGKYALGPIPLVNQTFPIAVENPTAVSQYPAIINLEKAKFAVKGKDPKLTIRVTTNTNSVKPFAGAGAGRLSLFLMPQPGGAANILSVNIEAAAALLGPPLSSPAASTHSTQNTAITGFPPDGTHCLVWETPEALAAGAVILATAEVILFNE